jgi:hypothetical protein
MNKLLSLIVGGGPMGYDFRADEEVDLEANGTYSSVRQLRVCF